MPDSAQCTDKNIPAEIELELIDDARQQGDVADFRGLWQRLQIPKESRLPRHHVDSVKNDDVARTPADKAVPQHVQGSGIAIAAGQSQMLTWLATKLRPRVDVQERAERTITDK